MIPSREAGERSAVISTDMATSLTAVNPDSPAGLGSDLI